jgi:hypothetical protein
VWWVIAGLVRLVPKIPKIPKIASMDPILGRYLRQ